MLLCFITKLHHTHRYIQGVCVCACARAYVRASEIGKRVREGSEDEHERERGQGVGGEKGEMQNCFCFSQ